jgi:iron(III) transport system permease protein
MSSSAAIVPVLPARRGERLRRESAQGLVWISVAVLVVVPLLPLLYASVRSRPLYESGGSFTLQGYSSLLSDPAFWRAALNTLEFAVTTTAIALVAGGGLAVLCERTDLRLRRVLAPLGMLPLLLPPLGVILGWIALYGDGGWFTGFITGTLHLPWDIGTPWGMGVMGASVAAPIALVIVRAALRGMDGSLEEAARSTGAGTLTVLARITIPMLRPALLSAAVLIFTISLEQLGIPIFLGATHNVNFLASYLYTTWSNSPTPDPPSISAGAVLFLLVATALLLVRHRLLGSEQRFVSASGAPMVQPLPLRRWRAPLTLLVIVYLSVTIFAPIGGLILTAFVSLLTPLISPFSLLTLDNFRSVFQDPTLSSSITNSVIVACAGAVATTGLIAVATLVAHRSRFVLRHSLRFLMLYPRSLPGIIMSLAFFWSFLFFVPPGAWIRNNLVGEGLALAVRGIPLAYMVMYPALARIATDLDDAGRSAGASWWVTSRRLLIPMLRGAIFASMAVVFVTILNDYEAAIFLAKPNTELMGVEMLQQYAKGTTGPVAALAVLQLAIIAGVLLVGGLVYKGLNRSARRA